MSTNYRGTYVVERETGDGKYEILMSVSDGIVAPNVMEAHDPLLHKVSTKIESLRHMLDTAEDEPTDPLPVEVVPNSPTIRSVETQKEN